MSVTSPGIKVCQYHPGLTSHSTKDCYTKGKSKKDRDRSKRKDRDGGKAGGETGAVATDLIKLTPQGPLEEAGLINLFSSCTNADSEISLSSTLDKEAIIIDSGATSPFVRDRSLLSNLVKLERPIPVQLGNGHSVLASHTGRLSFPLVAYETAYYVPDMVINLLPAKRCGKPQSPSAHLGLHW
jgi:hypothetical protein